jgi:chemotaxis protein CheD
MSLERPPEQFLEIFLQPGDWYFSDADNRLRTLLGSCVAITLWHPQRFLGGMCHFLLPTRNQAGAIELGGRYGDEALFLLLREARAAGCRPRDFDWKVFGGASMDSCQTRDPEVGHVGRRNVRMALELLSELGITPQSVDVGGRAPRSIMLDNWNGAVWVRSTADVERISADTLAVGA